MAKKSDKINGAEKTKAPKSKFRWGVLGASVASIGAALLVGIGVRNILQKTPEDPIITTGDNLILSEEEMNAIVGNVTDKYADIVEYQTGYGVKESSISYFDISEDALTIIGSSVFNTKNYPVLTTSVTLSADNWKEFYDTSYESFLMKYEGNIATSTDAVNIIDECAEFITSENVVAFTKLEFLNDNNIQSLLKSVVSQYVEETSTMSDNEKQNMSNSLITDELTFKQSGYAKRNFDANKQIYSYSFSAQFSLNGYSFNVNGTINNNAQIKSKAEFTSILLNEFENNPDVLIVVVTKDSPFTKVFNQQSNKTTEPEIEK